MDQESIPLWRSLSLKEEEGKEMCVWYEVKVEGVGEFPDEIVWVEGEGKVKKK